MQRPPRAAALLRQMSAEQAEKLMARDSSLLNDAMSETGVQVDRCRRLVDKMLPMSEAAIAHEINNGPTHSAAVSTAAAAFIAVGLLQLGRLHASVLKGTAEELAGGEVNDFHLKYIMCCLMEVLSPGIALHHGYVNDALGKEVFDPKAFERAVVPFIFEDNGQEK